MRAVLVLAGCARLPERDALVWRDGGDFAGAPGLDDRRAAAFD